MDPDLTLIESFEAPKLCANSNKKNNMVWQRIIVRAGWLNN